MSFYLSISLDKPLDLFGPGTVTAQSNTKKGPKVKVSLDVEKRKEFSFELDCRVVVIPRFIEGGALIVIEGNRRSFQLDVLLFGINLEAYILSEGGNWEITITIDNNSGGAADAARQRAIKQTRETAKALLQKAKEASKSAQAAVEAYRKGIEELAAASKVLHSKTDDFVSEMSIIAAKEQEMMEEQEARTAKRINDLTTILKNNEGYDRVAAAIEDGIKAREKNLRDLESNEAREKAERDKYQAAIDEFTRGTNKFAKAMKKATDEVEKTQATTHEAKALLNKNPSPGGKPSHDWWTRTFKKDKVKSDIKNWEKRRDKHNSAKGNLKKAEDNLKKAKKILKEKTNDCNKEKDKVDKKLKEYQRRAREAEDATNSYRQNLKEIKDKVESPDFQKITADLKHYKAELAGVKGELGSLAQEKETLEKVHKAKLDAFQAEISGLAASLDSAKKNSKAGSETGSDDINQAAAAVVKLTGTIEALPVNWNLARMKEITLDVIKLRVDSHRLFKTIQSFTNWLGQRFPQHARVASRFSVLKFGRTSAAPFSRKRKIFGFRLPSKSNWRTGKLSAKAFELICEGGKVLKALDGFEGSLIHFDALMRLLPELQEDSGFRQRYLDAIKVLSESSKHSMSDISLAATTVCQCVDDAHEMSILWPAKLGQLNRAIRADEAHFNRVAYALEHFVKELKACDVDDDKCPIQRRIKDVADFLDDFPTFQITKVKVGGWRPRFQKKSTFGDLVKRVGGVWWQIARGKQFKAVQESTDEDCISKPLADLVEKAEGVVHRHARDVPIRMFITAISEEQAASEAALEEEKKAFAAAMDEIQEDEKELAQERSQLEEQIAKLRTSFKPFIKDLLGELNDLKEDESDLADTAAAELNTLVALQNQVKSTAKEFQQWQLNSRLQKAESKTSKGKKSLDRTFAGEMASGVAALESAAEDAKQYADLWAKCAAPSSPISLSFNNPIVISGKKKGGTFTFGFKLDITLKVDLSPLLKFEERLEVELSDINFESIADDFAGAVASALTSGISKKSKK